MFHARVDMSCLICSRVFLCRSGRVHSVCTSSFSTHCNSCVWGGRLADAVKTVLIMVVGANDMGALYSRMLVLNKGPSCSLPFPCIPV